MKTFSTFFLVLCFSLVLQAQQTTTLKFDQFFTGEKTMRVDYFHTGTATEEHFSLDRVLNDGPWPGSRQVLLDELNRGLYFYKITDTYTNTLLYSRAAQSAESEADFMQKLGFA